MMRPLLVLMVLCCVPSWAQAKVLDIQEVTSEGGITAWLVEDSSLPVLAMEIAFEGAGSAQDPKNKQGLARLVSNTLDEGAGSLKATAFQKELRDLSISLSFSSGRDAFFGSLKTLSKNRERATDLLKLALTDPRFDNEALIRMRQANQSRVRSSLSNPEWMAARILNDKAYEGHPYAMNSGGTLSSLANIETRDLKRFHENMLGKNNLTVAVAGDITAADLKILLDEVFGDLPEVEIAAPDDIEIQNPGQTFVYAHDIPQSIIQIIQPGIAHDDPKYQMARVMNFILGSSGFGSRLTEEIREKRGLTYGVYSYFMNMDHVQGLSVGTSTQNQNVPEMLSLIRGEFDKMRDTPVSAQELKNAKAYLLGSVPLSLTSTDKIAGLMLSLQLDERAVDYLDQRAAQIEAVTPGDLQALAADLLNPQAFTTVIVGQPEGLEAVTSIETLPNVE